MIVQVMATSGSELRLMMETGAVGERNKLMDWEWKLKVVGN